jgi:hypothetical protein
LLGFHAYDLLCRYGNLQKLSQQSTEGFEFDHLLFFPLLCSILYYFIYFLIAKSSPYVFPPYTAAFVGELKRAFFARSTRVVFVAEKKNKAAGAEEKRPIIGEEGKEKEEAETVEAEEEEEEGDEDELYTKEGGVEERKTDSEKKKAKILNTEEKNAVKQVLHLFFRRLLAVKTPERNTRRARVLQSKGENKALAQLQKDHPEVVFLK